MNNRRKHILDEISDVVSRFLYYDRKEDEQLPPGAIEEAIKAREVSVSEITGHFENELRIGLKPSADSCVCGGVAHIDGGCLCTPASDKP